MSLLDSYNLRARAAPVFVLLIPAILAIATWAPDALSLKVGTAAAIVSVGLSMLVAQFGRNFGKQKETALWDGWGGPPTTQLLRHRNARFNSVIRGRYHQRLRELRPDLTIPTPAEEAQNPEAADQMYGAATRFLIGRTRDAKKFPLIFKENTNYGFLRNLWGLKPLGIVISALGAFACLLRLWLTYANNETLSPDSLGGSLISFTLFLAWIFWVTPRTVRVAADAYAERLFEACDQVE